MIAILSCTIDDLYLFNLPFAIYSWNKIGVDCFVMMPLTGIEAAIPHLSILNNLRLSVPLSFDWHNFEAPADKVVTYAQCSRLYAAAIPGIDPLEILITADADMCVFDKEYWQPLKHNGAINIVGADL